MEVLTKGWAMSGGRSLVGGEEGRAVVLGSRGLRMLHDSQDRFVAEGRTSEKPW